MSGKDPVPQTQAYEGVKATNPPNFIKAKRAPGVTQDKRYPVGTLWSNILNSNAYIKASDPNTWDLIGSGSGGPLNTLTTDDATVVSPSAGNINVAGNSTQGVSTSGSGSTVTVTVATGTTSQLGVVKLASNAQAIAGTDTANAVTAAALLAKLGATQTAHGVILGEGNTSAFSVTGAGSTGQVLIGATGADPAFGNLVTTSIVDVTGSTQTMAVATSYIADAASAIVVFTLPATAALGDRIEVIGNGPGGWQIAQNANQAIKLNSLTTTTGTGGSLSSTNRYNSVELYCVVSGASTIWNASLSASTLTFV